MERLLVSFALLRRNRVKRIAVPIPFLYAFVGLLIGLLVGGGFLATWLLNRSTDYGQLKRLVSENFSLKRRVAAYAAAADTFRQFLARTEEMDNRIRAATQLELIPADARMLGVGGPAHAVTTADPAIDNLLRRVRFEQQSLTEIDRAVSGRAEELARIPSIWPVQGWVTSGYGMRHDPFTGRREVHEGLDIVAPSGTGIVAPADGRVAFAGWKSGWGRVVEIDHGNGIRSFYGHCRALYVKPGARVRRGDRIAAVGSSGRSTGSHLHYGVKRNGVWVNPRSYVLTRL